MAEEVAVTALDLPFRFLRRRRIPVEPLLQGLDEPPEHFQRSRNRISWKTFAAIQSRLAATLGGNGNLPNVGRSLLDGAVWIPFKLIVGPFTNPRTLYRWTVSRGSKLFFSNISSSLEERPGGVQLQMVLAPGYEPSEEFHLINRGVFEVLPALLGYPPASVSMQRMGSTTIYDIHLVPKRELWHAARGFLRGLRLNRATAAIEIERALEQLRQDNQELQAAHLVVEQQAKKLQAIEELGRSLLREVEPSRIAETIRVILQERIGFQAVAYYAAAADGDRFQRAVCTFDDPLDTEITNEMLWGLKERLLARWPSIRVESLHAPEGLVGLLICLPRGDRGTDLELFEALLPHLTIAAKHSLAYGTIQELNRGLERRVEERTAQLSSAKADLLVTVQRLEDAMGARDKLFANLNHEFRTPITLMLLPLERMLCMPELEQFRPKLLAMEVNARRLLRLVDGVLELAASHEGRLRLRLERVDVAALARNALQAYAPAAQELKLDVALEAPDSAVVFGSAGGIERILENLLSNALKYTPAGGQIRVSVRSLADSVQLSISDDGIGIAPEDRERIFERFERAGAPVARGATATGIGLALVKELCNWHGGAIAVSSEPGKGSTFDVTLPCLPTEAVRARADRRKAVAADLVDKPDDRVAQLGPQALGLSLAAESGPAPQVAQPAQPAATVLVVEDHPDLRSELAGLLGASFHVLTAENGQRALEAMARQPVDLVLSDLVMPGVDGLELCKRIKATPAQVMVPFVLITALNDRGTLTRALDLGADDFLVKPFNEGELLARVRAQLRIRDLAKKLAESNRLAVIGTILSGMAHELRNPVNVLVNGIEPLRRSLQELAPGHRDVGALLDALDDAGERVNRLTEELLAFRRHAAETGERVGVSDLIDQSLALLKPKLGGVKLETDIGYAGEVRGSAHSLSQIVVNLVENAIQAVHGTGRIGIQAGEAPDGVWLDVWDDGPGVAAADRERLFESFFSTKPAGQGTGLGLAISRKIAERNGGKLTLQPSSQGARFRLTLPRASP